jgi:hypothetical protein
MSKCWGLSQREMAVLASAVRVPHHFLKFCSRVASGNVSCSITPAVLLRVYRPAVRTVAEGPRAMLCHRRTELASVFVPVIGRGGPRVCETSRLP